MKWKSFLIGFIIMFSIGFIINDSPKLEVKLVNGLLFSIFGSLGYYIATESMGEKKHE